MASMLDRIRGALSSPPAEMAASPVAAAVLNSTPLKAAVDAATPLHPYYPIEAEIVGYLANEWNTLELVSMFAAGCAGIFIMTYFTIKSVRPNVSKGDLVTMLWFVLCMTPQLLPN